ncbi:anti-sigma factor [Acidobacteria bacterium AH-259-D05]|nr:anti-sigma factor [Acidobacteria bacterium AH-259-D05]
MRGMVKCKECFDLLMDYLEENLDPESHKRLDEHFAACPSCLNFLESYRTCSEMAQQLRDQLVEIPQELESRLKTFLREEVTKG